MNLVKLRAPPRDFSALVVQTLHRKYVWISVCKTIPEAYKASTSGLEISALTLYTDQALPEGLKFTIHDYLPTRRHVAVYIADLPAPELG